MELNLSRGFREKPKKSQPIQREQGKEAGIKRKSFDEKKDNSNSWSRKKLKKQQNDRSDAHSFSRSKLEQRKGDFSSSLFSGNPTLPEVNLKISTQKSEPVFSLMNVSQLEVHPHLISCLENRLGIKKLTAVQQLAIPALLSGKEALIKSQTGSGKTLAYAIPIIQDLQSIQPQISRADGIHAVIVLPTRELAQQTHEWFHKLSYSFTWLVPGCFSGGEKRKSEKARIRKGISILISTPGRLVDHIQNTATLDLSKVRWLVLDEADRLLDMGYEKDVTTIVDAINRQTDSKRTIMLSATLSKGVEDLAHVNMRNPEIIDLGSSESGGSLTDFVTPSSLKHCFAFVPAKLRTVTLVSIICEKCIFGNSELKKAVVFLPTLDLVDYLYKLFTSVLTSILPIDDDDDSIFYRLHGNMKQENRVQVFNNFRDAVCGVLLTTDVAARGLELPNVDWIIQMSAPAKTEDYIHRVGRTARIGSSGHALILLLPSEENFINHLESNNLSLHEMQFNDLLKALLFLADIPNESKKKKMTVEDQANALQLHFEKSLLNDTKLHESAKDAFLSYVRSYASYPLQLRPILPFKELHLGHIAKSLCLRDTPQALGAGAYLRPQKTYERNRLTRRSEDQMDMRQKSSSSYKLSAVDTV